MEEINLQGFYLKDLLFKGIHDIYAAQRVVASRKADNSANRKSRSGQLLASLTTPNYKISAIGASVHAEMIYPTSIRFQDIKHLGNWKIYNKQVWRILYKETFRNMRYEFSDWLKERVKRQLSEALQPLNTK